MKKSMLLFVLMFSFFGVGCSTLADARAAKGQGAYRIYDKEYIVVWNAALNTVKNTDLALVTDDKEQGMILAQRGMTAFSYGENVAIFIEPINGFVKTRVEVVNKRALATNITAANWEAKILEDLDVTLGQ